MLLSVQTEGLISQFGVREGYKMIADAGFQAVDWNIDHAWNNRGVLERKNGKVVRCIFDQPMEEIFDFYREELDAMKENGLVIGQAHAPFPAYKTDDPDWFEYAIHIYKKCIEFCEKVGCPHLVIHGISRCKAEPQLTPALIDELNDRLYESLLEVLKGKKIVVCMENLFSGRSPDRRVAGHCADATEAAAYIDKMNEKAGRKAFALCLDTGHLFLLHKDFRDYTRKLGERIAILHVHDNSAQADDHIAPYAGALPWAEFCEGLHNAGYRGNMNFETFNAYDTGKVPRELVPEFLRHIAVIGNYFIREIEG